MCLFRVYENDKPVKPEHYLKWSASGAKDDELVFVSGHPGRTNRLNTVAELEYLRDTGYPFLMQRLNRLEVMLLAFSSELVGPKKLVTSASVNEPGSIDSLKVTST